MIRFIRAHGYDAGPAQRPLSAGAVAGALGAVPAGLVFVGFGSFEVAADHVLRLPRGWTAALIVGAFVLSWASLGWLPTPEPAQRSPRDADPPVS